MEGSLERLGVSSFDLYQMHAVLSIDELDQATAPGGALEGILAARDEGLTRHIGITTHGYDAPLVLLEALRRFDFDSVLFPYGFVQAADPVYRARVEEVLDLCSQRQVGSMVIKSITRGPWGPAPHPDVPWYAPFEDPDLVQQSVNFVLSQPVTGLCTVSSVDLLPVQLAACQNLRILGQAEQEDLIKQSGEFEPLWKPGER